MVSWISMRRVSDFDQPWLVKAKACVMDRIVSDAVAAIMQALKSTVDDNSTYVAAEHDGYT